MTQISRPFQIALVAMGLFVAVWFVALRGHSSGGGSSSSSAPASPPASSPASSSSSAGSSNPSSVYHGSAPGVAGLTRAIDKARGAVTQSQQNAQQLQQKSAQASSAAPSQAGAATSSQSTTVVKAHKTITTNQAGAKGAAGAAAKSASPSMQGTVEAELKKGKVVTILFWNPKASVDVKVRRELNALGHELGGKIAVHDALANQVGSFGSFTRTVQVDGTPTILIVNKQGQTTSLTGLTDVFALKQAVTEAKSAH